MSILLCSLAALTALAAGAPAPAPGRAPAERPGGDGSRTALRILRKQIEVAAPIEKVWAAWTTAEGLAFASERSRVELVPGGAYDWFLELEPDERGRRGSEGSRVLAFLPLEMLAFDWTFPPSIPSLRYADARTQVVVLFEPTARGVRIRFAQHGWREGADWDDGYAYFDRAWSFVLESLKRHLEGE